MNLSLDGIKVVIAGGSGFIGTSLACHLRQCGATVTILTRDHRKSNGPTGATWQHWDARTLGPWSKVLNETHALFNLVGRSVNCIKSPDNRDLILRSRIEATHVLGEAVRSVDRPPETWVQMSTAHWYGDPPEIICTEESPIGYGFAPDIAKAWEREFSDSVLPQQRGVLIRTSFVLGRDQGAGGGALSTLKLLARLGLGGRVGSGTQGMSWIHEKDLNRIFERSIVDRDMSGVYIGSSPHPVSQVEFMKAVRKAVGMPVGLPAYEWMVRLGAPLLLRTDPELALYGRYVQPKRLIESGFEFSFPNLRYALEDLFEKPK